VLPFLFSTDLLGALGAPRDKELADHLSKEELVNGSSEDELADVPTKEELELVDKTLAPGLGEPRAEQKLPSVVPSASNSSGVQTQGVDLVFTICHAWKSVIKSAIVIFHGYETSSSVLIFWGNARKHPVIDKGREARKVWMVATMGAS